MDLKSVWFVIILKKVELKGGFKLFAFQNPTRAATSRSVTPRLANSEDAPSPPPHPAAVVKAAAAELSPFTRCAAVPRWLPPLVVVALRPP